MTVFDSHCVDVIVTLNLFWLIVSNVIFYIEAPLLVGLLANNDPAAKQYAEWTGKACRADGIRYEIRTIDDPLQVERALRSANDDPSVHGIIVYYPIFGQDKESYSGTSQDDFIRDTVSFQCDVEGLCHLYRSNLYRNVRYLDAPHNHIKCIVPCTALSVVKILEACPNVYHRRPTTPSVTEQPQKSSMSTLPVASSSSSSSSSSTGVLANRFITIINRSEIVGRPLAAMLANDGAIVYSVDLNSIYKFINGTLHSTNETVEECVRKVRNRQYTF
jgi:methylenetetrahydrofolate dehydrogenase (NAD+)